MNMNQNQNDSTPVVHNKKNMIISGVVILAVLVALFVAPKMTDKKKEVAKEAPIEESQQASAIGAKTGTLTRAEATIKYTGSTIRFTTNAEGECVATPDRFVTTVNKGVMIDNDTDIRRPIGIGGKSYSVGGHRYTISSMNMGLGEHKVTCSGKEVATIVIQ